MDKFEYVVALAAVITGLGLSDVAVSVHRLLKRRAGVVWDWLPVVLALYASLVLMRLWYQLWSVRDVPAATGLPFVIVQVVETLVLVLVMSASLPDDDDFQLGRIDLREYYAAHGRYVWLMYLLFLVMWVATGVYFVVNAGLSNYLLDPSFHLFFSVPLLLTAIATMVGRRWQAVILIMLFVHELVVKLDLFGLGG